MLPYFYQTDLTDELGNFTLDEASSRHCSQVLRMQPGDDLLLTNGKGLRCTASILETSRKRTLVTITSVERQAPPRSKFCLGIAFTKNNSRNEWLLEKATEMGITEIFPILTRRGEKDKLRPERLNGILVSAMLQSQQVHLPVLHEAEKLTGVLKKTSGTYGQKFIAHCETGKDRRSYWEELAADKDTLVLIGPEGDFTEDEITQSLDAGCIAVSFGNNRLRTETAGLYACTVFNAKNYG